MERSHEIEMKESQMAPSSPSVAAWELGNRLYRARELAGLRSTEVAKTVGVAQNYMSNIEYGRRRVAEDKLAILIRLYGLEDEDAEQLRELRRAADGTGWWAKYSGALPPELVRFIGYEYGAHEVRTYEGALVSGLLQTEDYARALFAGDKGNLRPSDVEMRLEARLRRQRRLREVEPLRANILMSESALYQQVGGPDVLSQQLEVLLGVVDDSHLHLRIIPFAAGAYGALGSSTFHLLRFPGTRDMLLGWQETVTSLFLVQDEVKLHQYDVAFTEATDIAVDAEQSKQLIRRAREALR